MKAMPGAPEKEKIFYNSAWKASGCDYRKIFALRRKAESWEEVFSLTAPGRNAEKDFEETDRNGISLVFPGEEGFPESLTEIPWPPFAIYMRGSADFLHNERMSVVGTRKASEESIELARDFGRDLSKAGLSVVSGLAFGIDSAAHKGCLSADGYTAAVLACGLDEVYPRSNERLAGEILSSGGALISEYPPGTPPLPYRFIERNRIVSGFSLGIVVIEAPESSGSLATARFAVDQNREVFVTPGPAGSRNFFGSHSLIRKGARLVRSAGDVLEDIGLTESAADPAGSMTGEEIVIAEIIGKFSGPADADSIAETAGMEPREVNRILTILLLKNIVKEKEEGYVLTGK